MDKTYLENLLCRNLSEEERREELAITCHNTFARTNADRIRDMSDEEMANFLTKFAVEAFSAGLLKNGYVIMNEQDRLEWLKQPAEEE